MEESTNSNIGFPGNQPVAQPQQEPRKSNWKWLIILILFLVVIGGVTFFVFKSSRSSASLDETQTNDTSTLTNIATPQPTETPTSAPIDKTTIKIQVLNGTGIAGEAGILESDLNDLGYSKITVGNASDQNATDTQVTFSSSVNQSVVSEITGKLNEVYQNVTTGNSSLDSFDIQIVTGLRKGATAQPQSTDTPTSTPTSTPTATP